MTMKGINGVPPELHLSTKAIVLEDSRQTSRERTTVLEEMGEDGEDDPPRPQQEPSDAPLRSSRRGSFLKKTRKASRRKGSTEHSDFADPLLADQTCIFSEDDEIETDVPKQWDDVPKQRDPLLKEIFDIVQRLDDRQEKIEKQILGVFSSTGAAAGCGKENGLEVKQIGQENGHPGLQTQPIENGHVGVQLPPEQSRDSGNVGVKIKSSDSSKKASRKSGNDYGQLFVRISVQSDGELEWRCPKDQAKDITKSSSSGNIRPSTPKSRGRTTEFKPQALSCKLKVEMLHARGLKNLDALGRSDPYCQCAVITNGKIRNHDIAHTTVKSNTLDPGWYEEKEFDKFKQGDGLQFSVKDKDFKMIVDDEDDDVLGVCSLTFDQVYPNGFYGPLQLYGESQKNSSLLEEMGAVATGDDEIQDKELHRMLELFNKDKRADSSRDLRWATAELKSNPSTATLEAIKSMTRQDKDTTLNVMMAFIIVLNTIIVGIELDHESGILLVFDILFLLIFVIEMFAKIRLHGIKGYLASAWSWFDVFVIVTDIVQLISTLASESGAKESSPNAAVLRCLRLARLLRLGRVVLMMSNFSFLEDLVAMISGIGGGLTTLVWAVMLFVVVVYVCSLMFRIFFGNDPKIMTCEECGDVDITEYFGTVPRAMLTIFRFFFGDFSTIQGVNLYESIRIGYGAVAEGFVCLVFFVVFIGVFNVITAIFVERTLAAAKKLEDKRAHHRLSDPILWVSNCEIIIKHLFKDEFDGNLEQEEILSKEVLEELQECMLGEDEFMKGVEKSKVRSALKELEIDILDMKELFDILDNDNTGSLTLFELVDGLRRLRGTPRRSDIISVDLMVRDIQEMTRQILEFSSGIIKYIRKDGPSHGSGPSSSGRGTKFNAM